MGFYQGRALRTERARGPRRRNLPALLPRLLPRLLAVLAALAILSLLPWRQLRRAAVVTDVRVEGVHYLDAARVIRIAGIRPGADLLSLDLERVRQRLRLDPRIAGAEVARTLPRGVRIRVVEREPVLLVQHGEPWEIDSCGVLLSPLAAGVVADVPLLAGPRFERVKAGAWILTPQVRRGIAWVRALGAPDLQLSGQVSEVDVSQSDSTEVLLMSGTRVLSPAWPPSHQDLMALRVVLADLQHRGTRAEAVDMRFRNQVIVRLGKPAGTPSAVWSGPGPARQS
jgi:cell division protein FtsQ